ncbi:Fe(3+)-hydroxamate ABC transporter permease FhuB [Rhizobium sp. 18065]|uniref:Fe(3+)-hydroxamate ABC transporter permease FhuB n=2 Tax=Rhizobium TaxID=379 RepID=UPI00135911D2|nr:Fe(3+)-hydroxamate ABC transporter permease FhuB [Rhizobium sp. 18065]
MISRSNLLPLLVTLLLLGMASMLAWMQIAPTLQLASTAPDYAIRWMVLVYSTLPRMATALLCGAALSLSGALFQQVLRNPLASPTTLGISAGANLALVLTMLFFPALLGVGRDLAALVGSSAAAGLVFLLGARRGFSPFSLVMAGLVVSLWCGGLAAILTLLNERYLVSLYIWGAGSLSQQSWDTSISLALKLLVIGTMAALIIRPLGLIELGEAGAASVGLKPARLRFIAVTLAVMLAAFVTSAVGVIGFIGLVAPTLARLAGARRPAALLAWSTVIGASLLFFADSALMNLAGAWSDMLPTGAVTAVFGSPLLLAMLPRLKIRNRIIEQPRLSGSSLISIRFGLWFAGLGCLAILVGAIFIGRATNGDWTIVSQDLWHSILPLRWPRLVAAFASGAMLAAAGTILQRLTGNEMASPEVLGISAGATLGITIAVFFVAVPSLTGQLGYAAIGALSVLALIFLLAARSGLAPERVLLAGIALSAMADAVVGILGATGDPRTVFLMRWMSGSTYNVNQQIAVTVFGLAILLVAASLLLRRWLDLLPLGQRPAGSLGVPTKAARLALLLLAGLLSAAATLSVGPLTFVGLMAPHLAREFGARRATSQLVIGSLTGGGLMVLADWIGRTLLFPYEVPAGLVSALIGAPFLIILMRRKA